MEFIYFITHPEVRMDKSIPVPEWDLFEKGIQRAEKLLELSWISSIKNIYSSNETKAKTVALKLVEKLSIDVRFDRDLEEIDRSRVGFVEPEIYNQITEEFFANPNESARGWERATDAQKRIVQAVERIRNKSMQGNIAIVSHGGVGALLLSYLKKTPISRKEDQPGQGHYFVFDKETKELRHSWKPLESE